MRPCPACSSRHATTQGVVNGFEIVRCDGCRSLFTSRLPDATSQFDYGGYYGPENLKIGEVVRSAAKTVLEALPVRRTSGRFADLGFGGGAFLDAAKDAGWETWGVEISESAIEAARRRGHHALGLEESESLPKDFDLIVASEVVEHVASPTDLVSSAWRHLRPGGVLYLTTPCGDGLNARLLGHRWSWVVAPPEHLCIFSHAGIRQLLETVGFDVLQIRSTGLNPADAFDGAQVLLGIKKESRRAPGQASSTSSVAINSAMSASALRRFAKRTANRVLGVLGFGDTLKAIARKPEA
ncbi:MAG: class I SAM-dependent methyltransferase [Myxococcaceae bacterium]|nr:class I SAM-dependent methyltransferase [Myxococcaceae bacterium]